MSRKAPVGTYAILWLATSKPVFCKMKITTAIPFLAVFRLGVSTETFLTGDLFILSDEFVYQTISQPLHFPQPNGKHQMQQYQQLFQQVQILVQRFGHSEQVFQIATRLFNFDTGIADVQTLFGHKSGHYPNGLKGTFPVNVNQVDPHFAFFPHPQLG